MKLCNITFNINDERTILKQSIPESAAEDEDKTIYRVCLADSVAHCMQAIAVDNRNACIGSEFILREVTVDENSQFLIKPTYLYKRKLVPDALENNEYWYLRSLHCNTYLCRITRFDYEFDIAWTCIDFKDCKTIIQKYLPNFNICKDIKNSKILYQSAMSYCDKHHLYNESDLIWDDIAMLPWAQTIKIHNLEYEVIKEIIGIHQ